VVALARERGEVVVAQTLILVVDDDAPINELLCELLEDEGYTTQGCLTIAEAFHILESVRPALIIIDLWMETREAGWDFMQQLRNTPKLADIPLILCAANQVFLHTHADELKALNCGVVHKPFDVSDLLHAVETRLGAAPA
jgi:CheY-like chemotaxis protein